MGPESHPSGRLTVGSCLIQRWCWATADGGGTWLQLQQPPDYDQTRPRPASGAKSYPFLDTEPARPAQVCRGLLLRVAVLICFPTFKNCPEQLLDVGGGAGEEGERSPGFPLLRLHYWWLCSPLQPAYARVFYWWSDLRLPSPDTGWSWDEKGKTLGLKSMKESIKCISCVQPYARHCEK